MKVFERTRDSPVYELSFDGSHDILSEILLYEKALKFVTTDLY